MLARRRTAGAGRVTGGQTWITAVNYDSGHRVAFGRPGAPPATLADAVVASCSIPCWYRPAVIGRGLDVTVLTPGPEDLAAMGGNLMDSRRREAVFETSLRTSAAACPAP
jgi:hypothetical protein